MISVIRKTHIPSVALALCCSMSAKWCRNPGGWTTCALSCNGNLLRQAGIVVGVPSHDGCFCEIFGDRRSRGPPFQTGRVIRIVRRNLSVSERPQQVHQRQDVTDRQDRSASGGHHVQHLKLIRISMVPPRHAEVAEHELREEREVETDENDTGC